MISSLAFLLIHTALTGPFVRAAARNSEDDEWDPDSVMRTTPASAITEMRQTTIIPGGISRQDKAPRTAALATAISTSSEMARAPRTTTKANGIARGNDSQSIAPRTATIAIPSSSEQARAPWATTNAPAITFSSGQARATTTKETARSAGLGQVRASESIQLLSVTTKTSHVIKSDHVAE